MEPDTIEKIKRDLDAINARVAAFEKAQEQADAEPPMLTDEQWSLFKECVSNAPVAACARLRYVEAELARLREGLKVQEGDVDQPWLDLWTDNVPGYDSCFVAASREIQRHRALVTK